MLPLRFIHLLVVTQVFSSVPNVMLPKLLFITMTLVNPFAQDGKPLIIWTQLLTKLSTMPGNTRTNTNAILYKEFTFFSDSSPGMVDSEG